MSKVQQYVKQIQDHPVFHKGVSYLRTKQVLKHQIPLLTLMEVLYHQLKKDDISTIAYAIAFNFTFAIFPSIIFLFTLIPYIPIEALDDKILAFLADVIPSQMFDNMEGTISDIVSKPRGGLLSFGFVLAMYLATNGMDFLMIAFNKCYKTKDTRNYFVRRLISLGLTFLLVSILFTAIVLIIVGKFTINYLDENGFLAGEFSYYLLFTIKYVAVIFMLMVGLGVIYYFAPSIHKRWGFFSPGTLTATALVILVSLAYGYYFNNFSTYNKLYGSIGALIGFMLWLYFIALIIMIGFELNASIEKAHRLERFARNHENNLEVQNS